MKNNPYDFETPLRKRRNISAKIGDYLPTENISAWDFGYYTSTNPPERIQILTPIQVVTTLLAKYSEREFLVPLKYDEDSAEWVLDCDSITSHLNTLWKSFESLRANYYARIYNALESDTDPLLNYDRTETTTTTYGHTIAADTTHGKTTTTETDGSHVDDLNVYGFNSGATGADSETRSLTIDDTTTIKNGGKDESMTEHGGTDTVSIRAYGNIGTTTLQDMQIQQIQAQKNFITEMIIRDFVNTYTFY